MVQHSTLYIGTLSGQGLGYAGATDDRPGAPGVLGAVREPSALALSADRRTLYATSELVPTGKVTAIDVRDPLVPRVLSTRPSGGAGPTHLAVHGRFLVTAHYTDGRVATHPLGTDGRIGAMASVVRHEGAQPHAHQVIPDPTGQWLLSVDLGADAVFVHKVDQNSGAISTHSKLTTTRGTGPRHLAFHPDGRRVFLLGEQRAVLIEARWDATAGTLTAVSETSVLGSGAPSPTYPAEVLVSPDGRFVYATTRGEDAVAVLGVESGQPKLVQTASTGGAWPRHCAFARDDRWLYVANERSSLVTMLPRDPATGRLGTPEKAATVQGACWVTVLAP
ncbi:lactonase family protein [Actinokineospora auranticolor]|uniref:6-phosphogluconolactonase (Cycloisomerase 2 family) n=1 Tax=Actinokineospora auranticolor TaxID=155976 RepID=A0A2S6H074_9PSEU|nr:lactonase family protein [Actinokineospora auranticolor]PPK70826.1 6-phosphogluconolactonase (cycloisomerase 2 family) [Actinokineospora auranticolor]